LNLLFVGRFYLFDNQVIKVISFILVLTKMLRFVLMRIMIFFENSRSDCAGQVEHCYF